MTRGRLAMRDGSRRLVELVKELGRALLNGGSAVVGVGGALSRRYGTLTCDPDSLDSVLGHAAIIA